MKERKTASVAKVLAIVNRRLRVSTCSSDTRQGMISVLETILCAANVYEGFRYLTEEEMDANGMAFADPGISKSGRISDDSRRQYHASPLFFSEYVKEHELLEETT
tara:strand:- start:673 stop:990 length:318 start_codon:yes stop_codon:yes gene_type:complete